RRVITGHDADGKSVFTHDGQVESVDPKTKKPAENPDAPTITLIHRTTGWPVTNQGGEDELDIANLQRTKPDGTLKGVVCEVVTMPPSKEGAAAFPPHRNTSMDYGVVISGAVTLVLDNGVEKTMKVGDVYIQRGTMHSWKNASTTEPCSFMTVI
ncbi:hypothetical protein GQ53DRAFT_595971, partial [Thozetella sp. PMI_491]